MISKKLRESVLSHTTLIFNIVIMLLVISFIISMSAMNMTQNIESRAFDELESTARMQASAFKHHDDEQYQALELVADMLKSGRHFDSEKIQPTLNSIVRTFQLCALCMADTVGNTTDYQGNSVGSCSDRAYFTEIINGNSSRCSEYLETTKSIDEPRMIYSIPAYDESGEIIGVLFCSKEISVLEYSLFKHSELFDQATSVFVCDRSGNLIGGNGNAYLDFSEAESEQEGAFNVFEWNSYLDTVRGTDITKKQININGKYCFVACIPLDVNEWYLYCILDEQSASVTFSANQKRIEKIIGAICLTFAAALIYMFFLGKMYVSRRAKEVLVFRRYYENYKNILKEAQCTVLEYDINDDLLVVNQPENSKVKLTPAENAQKTLELMKIKHPEYDFDELDKELDLAAASGKTYSFESFLMPNAQELCWLRTIVIPMPDEDGAIKSILIALFDVSELHHEGTDAMEMYINLPGNVYRCKLNDIVQVDYLSRGLCKMLGYSYKEIEKIIGPERRYSNLIYEEDRPAFREFTRKLWVHGRTQTCEYRMICANGSLLEVSDAMYARRSSTGTMYGYSILTNLREYRQMQEKLKRVKQQLEHSRIKNANSQMQPHFLYNVLSSIREIVLENPEYASDLIYDFTTHLRACIHSMSSDSLISFAQELENVKAYVNIEKMRFGDRLNIVYDCNEMSFDIIPLSIQPLVENAIRHGIYERDADGGNVTLCTYRSGDDFIVCVEDDGVGFDFQATMDEVKSGKRDSNGLYNLIFRFETLMNAHVTVESSIGCGTRITVRIPVGGEI